MDRRQRVGGRTRRVAIGTFVARRRVPQPRAARQDGGHCRRGERGPVGPRPGVRLPPAGICGVRLSLRPSRGPVRGGRSRSSSRSFAKGAWTSSGATTKRARASYPAGTAAVGAADLDRCLPAADDAPGRTVGRCLRHRVASGCAGAAAEPWGGSPPRVPKSAGRRDARPGGRRHRQARGASLVSRCPWARSVARRRRSRGAPRVSARPASATSCACWIPAMPEGVEAFAPVIELVRRGARAGA